MPNGRQVRACGIVTLRQQPDTANGTIFVSLEDEISTAKGLFARLGVTAEFTTAVIEAQSVDRLFAAAELRFGAGDHQKRVRITRTDGRPAS